MRQNVADYIREKIESVDEVGENGVNILLNNGLGVGIVVDPEEDYFRAHLLDEGNRLPLNKKAIYIDSLEGDHSMGELSQVLLALAEENLNA